MIYLSALSSIRAYRYVCTPSIKAPTPRHTAHILRRLQSFYGKRPWYQSNSSSQVDSEISDILDSISKEWDKIDECVDTDLQSPFYTNDAIGPDSLLSSPWNAVFGDVKARSHIDCSHTTTGRPLFKSYVQKLLQAWASYFRLTDEELGTAIQVVDCLDPDGEDFPIPHPDSTEFESAYDIDRDEKAWQDLTPHQRVHRRAFREGLINRLLWAILIPHPGELSYGEFPPVHVLPCEPYFHAIDMKVADFRVGLSEVPTYQCFVVSLRSSYAF